MKRLLLTSVLLGLIPSVNAFPWSSDIVVKTDLGEKFIVKESAVSVIPNGVNNLVQIIKKDRSERAMAYQLCESKYLRLYKRREDYLDSKDRRYTPCELQYGIYFGVDGKTASDLFFVQKSKIKNIHYLNVRFRPIFVDLNRKKIAYDYVNVYCINPKLRDQTLAIWTDCWLSISNKPVGLRFSTLINFNWKFPPLVSENYSSPLKKS
tara:strand:- start:997 stop:1620 length:624 start_codon:yes stop_codon:yes gene_type:complete